MKYPTSLFFAFILAVLATIGQAATAAQEGPLELADLGRLVQLGHPRISLRPRSSPSPPSAPHAP